MVEKLTKAQAAALACDVILGVWTHGEVYGLRGTERVRVVSGTLKSLAYLGLVKRVDDIGTRTGFLAAWKPNDAGRAALAGRAGE